MIPAPASVVTRSGMTVVFLAMGCGSGEAPEPHITQGAIDLVGPDALRERMFAPSRHGRIVNFWATWCGPCREEFPHLKAFAVANPDIEVMLVSLDLASLKDKVVVPFVAEHGLATFHHALLDSPDPVAALGEVVPEWANVVPVTLVVDSGGSITRRFDRAITAEDLVRP
jgi:thiol-disulfide isomerase/thioredoxin